MALDDLLIHIGELGRYQWFIFVLASLGTLPCPVTLFSQVFFTVPTPHWCSVGDWGNDACSEYGIDTLECEEIKRNVSIPVNNGHYEECMMYNITGVQFDPYLDATNFSVTSCQYGWVFDETESGRTLTTKFELVCHRETLIHVSQSLYFIGCLIGCPLYGSISDRIGRLYSWGLCLTQSLIFAIGIIFTSNFTSYTIVRTLMAISNYALWIIPFVYITEIVGYRKRMLVGLLVEFFWAGGYLLITAISWGIKDWLYLEIVVILIHVVLYPILFIIPESPRWLLATDKIDKAEEVLKLIAKKNGKEMPPNFREELLDEKMLQEREQQPDDIVPMDIFLNTTLLRWTLVLVVIWFGHGITYFGLTFISGDLGFPFYPSFFIQAAVEGPAYLFCIILLSYVGRRYPISIFMVVAGVACIVALFMPLGVWKAIIVFTAKFAICVSFVVLFVYSAEIFPTAVRGFGLGFLAIISLIGETISPLILIVSHWWPAFPLVFCGTLTIIGGVLNLLLPETRGTVLPETMEEVEALGKKRLKIPSDEAETKA